MSNVHVFHFTPVFTRGRQVASSLRLDVLFTYSFKKTFSNDLITTTFHN